MCVSGLSGQVVRDVVKVTVLYGSQIDVQGGEPSADEPVHACPKLDSNHKLPSDEVGAGQASVMIACTSSHRRTPVMFLAGVL